MSFNDFFYYDLGRVTISFVMFFKIASGVNAKVLAAFFSSLGVC